ncbi:MAG: exodeoxyribonuclease VII small subunit [Ruminococcus sp.]|nr:exodeoxyribonuclease VII small subunit [Ruminococcus sp.]
MTFEENLAELSKIVSELEKGELPLEKAVELYEKGLDFSEKCKKELDSAKLKITEN